MTTQREQDPEQARQQALTDAGIAPDYEGERRWKFFAPPAVFQAPERYTPALVDRIRETGALGLQARPVTSEERSFLDFAQRYKGPDQNLVQEYIKAHGLAAPEPGPERGRLADLARFIRPRIPGFDPFAKSAAYTASEATNELLNRLGASEDFPRPRVMPPEGHGKAELAGAVAASLVPPGLFVGPDLGRPDVKPLEVALAYPGLGTLQVPEQFLLKARAQLPGAMGRIAGAEAAAARAESTANIAPYRASYEQWAMASKGLTQDEAKVAGDVAEAFANQVERATGLPAEEYFRQARFQGVQRTAVPIRGGAPEAPDLITLYRGEPKGVRPPTSGGVPFTEDRTVAEVFAGKEGHVRSIQISRAELARVNQQKFPEGYTNYYLPEEMYQKATIATRPPTAPVTSEVQALARSAPSGLTLPATEAEAMAQATALGHADVDGLVIGPKASHGAKPPPPLPPGVAVPPGGGPPGPGGPRGLQPASGPVPLPPLNAPPYEKEVETVIRQWSGMQNVAEEEAKQWYQRGERIMKATLKGQKPSEVTMDSLFRVLHGEPRPGTPAELAELQTYMDRNLDLYRYLVAGRDAEQARSLAFDPTMQPRFMAHPDYFPRGWKPPKGVMRGRGGIGATPSFKKPRVDATYTQMRDEGWEPASWNPLAMMAERSLSGARYRGQMTLIRTLERRGLALPWREIQEQGLEGWRVPRVGPAFEGRPIKVNNSFLRTGETAVPNVMADMLEAEAGRAPRLAVEGVNIVPAIRTASDLAKSIKLVSSFFQQIDFTTRSLATAFSLTGLRQGAPIKFPGHVLKMAQLQFIPGAVQDFRSWILSDEPIAIVKGMRGPSPRMLAEEGLGIKGDISMIRREFRLTPESQSKLGALFGDVLQKLGVDAEGKPIRLIGAPARRLKAANEFMQKGLFDGVYMESQKFAAKNFVVPLLMKAHPEWTQRQIAGAAANEINKMFSTLGIWQTVLKQPGVRELARDILFSSNESEALIRQAVSTVRGPNTRLWREYHLGLALSLAAIGNLIHYWATGRFLPAGAYNPVVINDPYSPFKVSYNRKLFSPQVPGIEGRGDTPVTLDMVGQMDSMLNIALDPMGALGARTNVLPRMIMNQANGSDFFGRELDNPLLRASQALEDVLLPIGGGNIAGALLPEGRYTPEGERRLGVKGQLVQATGLNLRSLPTLDLIRASIVKHGFEKPDGSPAFDMSDLSPVQLRELKKDPLLMEELGRRQKTGLLHGAEGAKAGVQLDTIDLERRAAIDGAAQRLRAHDMTPQDFRAAVDDAQMVAAIRKKQTLETYGLLEDSRPDDPFKAALWDYYQIFTTKGARRVDGTVDHDKMETMLATLEKQWPPMVARYVRENTGLAPTDDPDTQRYFELKRQLRDMGYWNIYKGDPDYTRDPQIMADYEAWRDAKRTGRLEEWQRSVGGSKRAQDYMERLDRREKHAHEYLRSQDPAVDLAYSRYYGGAPVLPENQARVASEEGMDRQLSVIGIESQARQALLRRGIDTIDKVAGMTEEALAELPGIGDKTAATILKRARAAAAAMEKLRSAA